MNIWEAKYKALSAGIDDSEVIQNAVELTEQAIKVSVSCAEPFENIFYAMLQAVFKLQHNKTMDADKK